jgi:hypothetical protein
MNRILLPFMIARFSVPCPRRSLKSLSLAFSLSSCPGLNLSQCSKSTPRAPIKSSTANANAPARGAKAGRAASRTFRLGSRSTNQPSNSRRGPTVLLPHHRPQPAGLLRQTGSGDLQVPAFSREASFRDRDRAGRHAGSPAEPVWDELGFLMDDPLPARDLRLDNFLRCLHLASVPNQANSHELI